MARCFANHKDNFTLLLSLPLFIYAIPSEALKLHVYDLLIAANGDWSLLCLQLVTHSPLRASPADRSRLIMQS